MKRNSILLASAALAATLAVSGSAWAQDVPAGPRWGYPNYPYDRVYNPGSYGYWPAHYDYSYNYGYPYGYTGYSADYGNPFGFLGALTAPITAIAAAPVTAVSAASAPMVTGRSVATGQMGNTCSTPARTCELYRASWVGNGCSCRVPGGRSRGSVTP